MRLTSVLAFVAAALLFGCGSDGSGAPPGTEIQEKVVNLDLGMVRGDQPTILKVDVAKPFYHEATAELAEPPTGPFAAAEGMLPARVPAGEALSLWLSFTPLPGLVGEQEGTMRLQFRRAGSSKRRSGKAAR